MVVEGEFFLHTQITIPPDGVTGVRCMLFVVIFKVLSSDSLEGNYWISTFPVRKSLPWSR